MMMLKGPLQLYTTTPILTYSDQLGSKILGNYSLLSLSITPQDLLYMTMQEPEIYVGQENNATVLVENHISNCHQDNLEFMNQFINRIMLVDTPQFTYQDEVFVSTVLQKLGITNISGFISQVRNTTEHTELLQNLVSRYFEEGTVLKQTADRIWHKDYIQTEKQIVTDETDNINMESVYMNIAKRLHIAENNNILYEYNKPAATGVLWNHTTMTLMPFIEQADMIELQQLRNDIYRQKTENVMPQINVYENMELRNTNVTESLVMGTLNSAILLNLIKDVNYEVNQSFYADRYFWQDYKNVMYGNALDTFQRFENYQQMETSNIFDKNQYIDHMTRLYQDEYSMVQMLFRVSDFVEEHQESSLHAIAEHTYLSLMGNQSLQQILTQGAQINNRLAQNLVNARYYADDVKILNQLKEKEESILLLKEIAKENFEHMTLSESENNVTQNNDLLIEKIRQNFDEKNEKYINNIDCEVNYLHEIENMHLAKNYHTNTNHNDRLQIQNVEHIENLEQLTYRVLEDSQIHDSNMTVQEYITYLDAINEKNLHMQQILRETKPVKQKTGRVVVDRKQARKQSLRALENPEEVIREIYENSRTIEREVPVAVRQYLQLTDETTRTVLEELMGLGSHDTSKEGAEQIERHISTVEQILNRKTERIEENYQVITKPEPIPEEVKTFLVHYMNQIEKHENQIRQENTVANTTVKMISQELTGTITNIENKVIEKVKAPITHIESLQREDVAVPRQVTHYEMTQLVHKEKQQLRDEIKEEVLNSIERMQINTTQELDYQQVESITRKQMEETRNEIIKRQQETIQEIVNRKLMTQMRTISDKVYKDIERKLQEERRRRGY